MRAIVALLLLVPGAFAAAVDDVVEIQGDFTSLRLAPGAGGFVERFESIATKLNAAGGEGLLQEGFGVGNFYVPNRRLNEKLEAVDSVKDRPVLQYSYDCDGPNIKGLHVTRTVEPIPNEASIRVTWKIEHKGEETQWVAPWVRNDVTAGGAYEKTDRIDIPSVDGVINAERNRYFLAARNWAAVTDPQVKETFCAVFNADQLHSFLGERSEEGRFGSVQAAFVPKLMKPGDTWQTVYRVNLIRGLARVDFATDELATQIEYRDGKLEVYLSSVKRVSGLQLQGSVRAMNKRVWRLPAKKFDLEPGTVIRCSFPWESPGAGVYEFMARLSLDGKDYMLGKDTASPHGGIDTQFVVGTPKEGVSFEPWTDAPFALNRGTRTLKRSLAAQGTTAVWFESALEKIFPEDQVQATGKVQPAARLVLARNESESFQIVLRPAEDRPLFDVNVKVGALANDTSGDRIAEPNVRVSTVAYYPVRVPSHFEGPTGMWPDALPPLEPFGVKGGQCQPLWITVHVPAGTAAGRYSAPIAITAADSDPIELFVHVDVLDFDLPVTPALKTDFGFDSGNAMGWCKALGYTGTEQDLDGAYLDMGLSHRVTLRELVQMPAESADYAAALKAYAPKIASALKRGASTVSAPASLMELPEQLAQANTFVAKQGLKGKAFCQIANEPLRPAWPRLLENMNKWKASAPDVPMAITTFGTAPFFHDLCNVWAAHLPVFDTVNNSLLLGEIAKGKEVWWYVNQTPPRPYANFFIDFACIEHRILFWQTWALGIKGVHYWAANYTEQGENPWFDQLDVTPCNGDGFLMYPSPKGPVSSIRLEAIRDGIEDYDYLALYANLLETLKKKGGNAALVEKATKEGDLKALVPDLVSYPRDPNALLAKREALGRLIVEMAKAAK